MDLTAYTEGKNLPTAVTHVPGERREFQTSKNFFAPNRGLDKIVITDLNRWRGPKTARPSPLRGSRGWPAVGTTAGGKSSSAGP